MKKNLLLPVSGLFAVALFCLPVVPAQAQSVSTEVSTSTAAPVVTTPSTTVVTPSHAVTESSSTTVSPAPVVSEHSSSTTTSTHVLTHDEKERMEKDAKLEKRIDRADRKHDEKVDKAVEKARD